MPLRNTQLVQQLAQLALALTAEKNHARLLEKMIDGCMTITNCDAATLYTLDEQDPWQLNFTVVRNLTLEMNSIELPGIQYRNADGESPKLVVAQTFLQQSTINVPDAYHCQHYDFSGTTLFDRQFNYHSKSFLCVPLKDHDGEMMGVLQLINAQDDEGKVIPFSSHRQLLVESISSMAATALTKRKLLDAQRDLLEACTQMLARAIDRKSPVTGKHCENVPAIATILAQAVCDARDGPFADIQFSDEEFYELKIAAWLHDCGKIATPEHIIDKSTKLQSINDRIALIQSRANQYKQHLLILSLQHDLQPSVLNARHQQLDDDLAFLEQINKGGEFLSDEAVERINAIAKIEWTDHFGENHRLLTADEAENLKIRRGTLNNQERKLIQDHIVVTQEMLAALPYPKPLANVAEIAGNHHECINGKGYPNGLTGEQMSLRARIMCIADIFEALTSPDRPYKKGMMLSQALTIIGRMVEAGQLDPLLFRLFVESRAYMRFANSYMDSAQIDEPDLATLPGLQPVTEAL